MCTHARGPGITLAYDPPMRTLLIIAMMVLVPLRAWAGDVMAISMATAPALAGVHAAAGPAAAAATGSTHDEADAIAHADCLGHAGVDMAGVQHPGTPSEGDTASTHCPTCSLCQVCSSPGLAIAVNLAVVVRVAHAVPLSEGTQFTSAERAGGFKPPIS